MYENNGKDEQIYNRHWKMFAIISIFVKVLEQITFITYNKKYRQSILWHQNATNGECDVSRMLLSLCCW